MGEVDWYFHPGREFSGIPLTPKHVLPYSLCVAYINDRHDFHFGELARIESANEGYRVHKREEIADPCFLLYLITDSGAHGWWAAPDPRYNYKHGFHPLPRIFSHTRQGADDGNLMITEGMHPSQLWDLIVSTRLNGDRHNKEALSSLARQTNEQYAKLFQKDFWYLEKIRAGSEVTASCAL